MFLFPSYFDCAAGKNQRPIGLIAALCFSVFLLSAAPVQAWNDRTHLAVAKAAGYKSWYNAAGADIAKLKAGPIERYNHIAAIAPGRAITAAIVLAQVKNYNNPQDTDGHIYGAIIAAVDAYASSADSPKYTEYHIALCAHYCGDLSQPFHNIAGFKQPQGMHTAHDVLVEDHILEQPEKITARMYPVTIRREALHADLAREIARIAAISRELGFRLIREKRTMTNEEAYAQLGHSAALLQAILQVVGKEGRAGLR